MTYDNLKTNLKVFCKLCLKALGRLSRKGQVLRCGLLDYRSGALISLHLQCVTVHVLEGACLQWHVQLWLNSTDALSPCERKYAYA